MKKLLFFIMASLCLVRTNAQSIVKGEKIYIAQDEAKIVSENFSSYEVIRVDIAKFKQDIRKKTKEFTFDLGTDFLRNIKTSMEENEIRTADFQSYISNGKEKIKQKVSKECHTYKGIVDGDKDQWHRVYLDDVMLMGMFSTKDYGEVLIEPLYNTTRLAASKDKYIIYQKEAIISKNGGCGGNLLEKVAQMPKSNQRLQNPGNDCRSVRVAIEVDAEWNVYYGGYGPAFAAINYADGVYHSNFNVRFQVLFQNLWWGSDPYSATNADAVLDEFKDYWNPNMGWVSRDLTHLFTGRSIDLIGDFSVWGNAKIGIMCNQSLSYGYTSLSSPHVPSVTTHELGHNLGANHHHFGNPNNCDGTVMCQGSQSLFTSIFNFQSINEINGHLNSNGSCLDGVPNLNSTLSFNGDLIYPNSSNGVCTGAWLNFYSPYNNNISWDINNNGTNAFFTNTSNNQANASSGGNEGAFSLKVYKSNGCGYAELYYNFDVYNCGSFSVYPNAATDELNIAFDKVEKSEDLPDIIELFSENSTIALKSISPKELYNKKQFRDKIEIDVKDLTRGTYFLHLRTNKNKDKPNEVLRIILE